MVTGSPIDVRALRHDTCPLQAREAAVGCTRVAHRRVERSTDAIATFRLSGRAIGKIPEADLGQKPKILRGRGVEVQVYVAEHERCFVRLGYERPQLRIR